MAASSVRSESTIRPWTVRDLLLPIIFLSLCGTGAELLLLGHTETFSQFIPLAVVAGGGLALGWLLVWRRAVSIWVFRLMMLLFVIAGVTGVALHYRSNVEFEVEMYPSLSGWDLFEGAMSGALPALAPGAMIQIGLLGLVYTFRHPVLDKPASVEIKRTGETK
jgi:hypothetical protein